jgi:hypothetical protein
MPALFVSLSDARDWALIIYCIIGALLFFLGSVLVGALIWVVFAAKGMVKDLVNDSVKPALGSIKDTAESIKGTTDFVGQNAVRPIIRTYGMASGVRRGLEVLSGLSKRGKG